MRTSNDTDHRIARAVEANMLIVVTALPAALRQLDQCRAGYPTGQPGSGDGTSRTEALAITDRADEARRDRERVARLLTELLPRSNEVANIIARWHDGSSYSAKDLVQNRADDVWCRNCITHGHMSPRKKEHANCSWCVSFHHAEGWWPTRELVDMHAQGRRIREDDVARHRPNKKRRGHAA